MKKLISLLSIPLIVSASCNQKEPIKEDYNSNIAPINVANCIGCFIKDFDNDGQADAILDNLGVAGFYVESYENKVTITKRSLIMTSDMRKSASDLLKNHNSLEYETAKAVYESNKSKK